jgi:hypothetical protein
VTTRHAALFPHLQCYVRLLEQRIGIVRDRLVAEPIAGEVEQHDAIKELSEPLEHLVEGERGLGEAVQQ